MMDPNFTDQLLTYARMHNGEKKNMPTLKEKKTLNYVGGLPNVPAFLIKYVG